MERACRCQKLQELQGSSYYSSRLAFVQCHHKLFALPSYNATINFLPYLADVIMVQGVARKWLKGQKASKKIQHLRCWRISEIILWFVGIERVSDQSAISGFCLLTWESLRGLGLLSADTAAHQFCSWNENLADLQIALCFVVLRRLTLWSDLAASFGLAVLPF